MPVPESDHDHDSAAESAGEVARETRDQPAVGWAARLGWFGYGVVHLLVAWLAIQLAFGDREGKVSGEGALHQVAQQPLGTVAVWLAAGGFAALVIWEVCQAIGGHRDLEGVRRLAARGASAGRAAVFGVLATLAGAVATGSSSGGGTHSYTAQLMQMAFGPALVVSVGIGIACVGVASAYQGFSGRWRRRLGVEGRTGPVGRVVEIVAPVGFVSRGAAFVAIGGLFVWAGLAHDAEKSGGLDLALTRVRDEPFGPWLIASTAMGLACYGVFNVVRAWFLREG